MLLKIDFSGAYQGEGYSKEDSFFWAFSPGTVWVVKVHYIVMNEPAFRWFHWVRIRADEALELWRRQELATENEMAQTLILSNNSLLASMALFSSGPWKAYW